MATKLIIIENANDQLIDCAALPKTCLELVGRGGRSDQSLKALIDLEPDVVLIGGGESLEKTITLIRALLERGRKRILVVGRHRADRDILELLIAGADGYLDNRQIPVHLEKAALSVFAGETWVSRKVVSLLLDRLGNFRSN